MVVCQKVILDTGLPTTRTTHQQRTHISQKNNFIFTVRILRITKRARSENIYVTTAQDHNLCCINIKATSMSITVARHVIDQRHR